MSNLKIPVRSQVAKSDKWDLEKLYASEADWQRDLEKLPALLEETVKTRETLENIETLTSDVFLAALKSYEKLDRLASKVGHYASLMKSADASDTANNERIQKFMIAATEIDAKMSWFMPLLMKLPEDKLLAWCELPEYADYKVYIKKRLYLKAHILSEKEEKIISLFGEALMTPQEAFSILSNVSFDFGTITTKDGEKPLTNSSYSQFLQNEDRSVREKAYKQYYAMFDTYKDTIATLYAGNVKTDVAYAKIKGFPSARQASLYYDKVDEAVYDNLIATVRKNFAPLHKFYAILKKTLKLSDLRHYDVYMPLVANVKKVTPYDEAVTIVHDALQPLGDEYVNTITDGLRNGWVDRYENAGKRSGAFSSGDYDGYPYILLNYKEDVIRDVFTLAHEGGHSMHSWYSVRNNPYMSYSYTIFEAEVASTFNEELLFRHLLKNTTDKKTRGYLLSIRVGDILATLYRQTMFAEFEKMTHAALEAGTPLTTDYMRHIYRQLLEDYFGPEMKFEDVSDLECFRIPHFYNAFYVYKYATGISASLALADRVLNGKTAEREDYFKFLKSGGSRYPIEALKVAGVDMSQPEPVQNACSHFAQLVNELEKTLAEL
ncbi:MAG: oligoendopeptidase F [Treponemataceae bacterium]